MCVHRLHLMDFLSVTVLMSQGQRGEGEIACFSVRSVVPSAGRLRGVSSSLLELNRKLYEVDLVSSTQYS